MLISQHGFDLNGDVNRGMVTEVASLGICHSLICHLYCPLHQSQLVIHSSMGRTRSSCIGVSSWPQWFFNDCLQVHKVKMKTRNHAPSKNSGANMGCRDNGHGTRRHFENCMIDLTIQQQQEMEVEGMGWVVIVDPCLYHRNATAVTHNKLAVEEEGQMERWMGRNSKGMAESNLLSTEHIYNSLNSLQWPSNADALASYDYCIYIYKRGKWGFSRFGFLTPGKK